MAVTSNRSVTLTDSGDIHFSQAFSAAANSSASGMNVLIALASGANTITPPTSAKAVTIIPPSGNAVTLTLKGVTGDTGVPLSLVDPTSIGLASAAAFCLTAGNTVTVRFIYS